MNRRQLLTGSAAAAVAAVVPSPAWRPSGVVLHHVKMTGAEVMASRAFQMQEIARIFQVPGELLRDSLLINGEPPANPYISFMNHAVKPWLKRAERDLMLCGNKFEDQDGNRIDPRSIKKEESRYAETKKIQV